MDDKILLNDIQEVFSLAIINTLGEDYRYQVDMQHNKLGNNPGWRKSGDFISNICLNIFRTHVRNKNNNNINKEKINKDKDEDEDKEEDSNMVEEPPKRNEKHKWEKFVWPPLKGKFTTKLGTEVEYSYNSPVKLAHGIISSFPEIEEDKRVSLIANINVFGKAGKMIITSRKHLEWHLTVGDLCCHTCGSFFKGSRGLRIHQMDVHNMEYEPAEKMAQNQSQQLIRFTSKHETLLKWESEVDAILKAKNALDEGLEAARDGNLNKLKSIIQDGWSPHTNLDRNGCNALCWAAGEGHVECCKYLIEECQVDDSVLTGKLKRRRHCLHWAARNGHINVCSYLIKERNIDQDIPTEDGTTPLHYAAMMGHINTCIWLVDIASADMNRLNIFGCNASQWCALNGSIDQFNSLMIRGMNVQLLNRNGHSVLHKAAMKGHQDLALWLVKPIIEGGCGFGLNHMLPDDDGFTPMSFARANGYDELYKKLQIVYENLINGDETNNEEDDKDKSNEIEKKFENFNINSCD